MNKIDGSHYDVQLTRREHDMVRLWIESSAAFAGTYAVYNRRENAVAESLDMSKVTLGKPVGPIVERRCLTCHGSVAKLGRRGEKQRDDQWSKEGKPPEMLNTPLYCWNLYNLSHPEKSMILLAPLAKESGGYEWCKASDGQPAAVFRDTQDPDYQAILQAVQAAKTRQEKFGRPGHARLPSRRSLCPLDEALGHPARNLRPSPRPDRPLRDRPGVLAFAVVPASHRRDRIALSERDVERLVGEARRKR